MSNPLPERMSRTELAVRLHSVPPQTVVTATGLPVEQQVRLHRIAVGLLASYRGGVLLDYTAVRRAICHDNWVTVRVDWQSLASLADDMGGGRGPDRQRAAYQDIPVNAGDHRRGRYATAVRHVRPVLAVAAGIALGEITAEEATALAAALTALGQAPTPSHVGGGDSR